MCGVCVLDLANKSCIVFLYLISHINLVWCLCTSFNLLIVCGVCVLCLAHKSSVVFVYFV